MSTPKVVVELSAVDRFSPSFGKFTAGLETIENKATGLASAFARLPVLGGLASFTAITAGIKSTIDGFDNLAKAAQRYGVSVESLSALQYAGRLSDVEFDTLGKALKTLSLNAVEAAAGTGEAKDAFKAMGISVLDAGGKVKAGDVLFREIADRFATYADGANKTALAAKVMGERLGPELIPMMNAGSRGLAEMGAEAEAFGAIVGGSASKAAEQFNDNLTRLGTAFEGLRNAAASSVLDQLVAITDAMVDSAKSSERMADSFDPLAEALRAVAVLGANVGFVFQGVGRDIGGMAAQIDALGRGDVAGFRRIHEMLVADAAKARTEFDALEARLMGLGSSGQTGKAPGAQEGGPKSSAPGLSSRGAKAKAGARGLTELERFAERIQRERMAEYDKYAREVTPDDLDAQAAEQAKSAIKAAEDRSKRLASLYGQTAAGKHEALIGNLQFIESMRAAGQVTDLQAQAIVEDLYAVKEAGEDAFGGIARSIKDMGNKAADAFADMLVDGKASFTGLVNAWLKDLARIEARKALDPLTNAAGGFIDRALGNLFGGSSLGRMPTPSIAEEFPAFATGGRFTVGGAGGTDSKLVAFRATPGERVTVETPSQQRGGGQAMVFNIDARGADLGVAQRIEDGVRRAVALSVQAVAATADRGGGYARALGRR